MSDEQVQAIYDLVKWAPTSMNNQPLRIVLVRSPQARARLVESMADGNKTEAAPLVAILAADIDFHDELRSSSRTSPAPATSSPAARPGRRRSSNAALQIAYFTRGARAGLAAGPMTGLDTASVDRAFFPDGRHRDGRDEHRRAR